MSRRGRSGGLAVPTDKAGGLALELKNWAWLCLVLAPLLWGGNFVVAKMAVPDIHALWLNIFRWMIAACIVVPLALPQMVKDRAGLTEAKGPLLLLAGLGIVGFNTVLYLALESVSASVAAIGFATTPILILLLLAVIDMRLPAPLLVLACIASIFGVYLVLYNGIAVCSGDTCIDPAHLGLVFAAALIWATYCIFLKKLAIKASSISVFATTIVIGIAVQLPVAAAFVEPPDMSTFSSDTFLYIVYLGVFASAVAFLAWGFALRMVDAGQASLFLNLVPVSSLVLGFAFLGERMELLQLLGAGLVLISLVSIHVRRAR